MASQATLPLHPSPHSTSPPSTSALSSSNLRLLPPELFMEISSHLPLASRTSFALTCRHIGTLVAHSSFKPSSPNFMNRHHRRFIELLARDSLDHVECVECISLHPIISAEELSKREGWYMDGAKIPRCYEFDGSAENYFHDARFSSAVFNMALKLKMQGEETESKALTSELSKYAKMNHSSSLDMDPELDSYSEYPQRTYQDAPKYATLSNSSYTVVGNGKLLQKHEIAVLSTMVEQEHTPNFQSASVPRELCQHLEVFCGNWEITIQKKWPDHFTYPRSAPAWNVKYSSFRKRDGGSEIPKESNSGLVQCSECEMEFNISFEKYPTYGIVMFFTRWVNLGYGPVFRIRQREGVTSADISVERGIIRAGINISKVSEACGDLDVDFGKHANIFHRKKEWKMKLFELRARVVATKAEIQKLKKQLEEIGDGFEIV